MADQIRTQKNGELISRVVSTLRVESKNDWRRQNRAKGSKKNRRRGERQKGGTRWIAHDHDIGDHTKSTVHSGSCWDKF